MTDPKSNKPIPPRYSSLGISLLHGRTIYDVYQEETRKMGSTALQAIEVLKQGAYQEILRLDPEATEPLSEEMLIRRADSLAAISTDDSITHSGYVSAVGWKQVRSAAALHCVILAHCFHMDRVGLFIPPRYVPLFDWPRLLPLLGVTYLKYVSVPLDDGSNFRRASTGTRFWDAARDRCYVLVETDRYPIEEIEDGYPYEFDFVTIGEKEIPMDASLLEQRNRWLAGPGISQEEADQEFYPLTKHYEPWKLQ